MKKYPQVLLLGNGINRNNGASGWSDFIEKLVEPGKERWINTSALPMPLQAILVSNNTLGKKLAKAAKEMLSPDALKDNHHFLSSLLSIEFDEILTTNYTYELEQACFSGLRISENRLKKMHTNIGGERAEKKYLLKTCNKTFFQAKERRIWHIHGEARKPSSMILGHNYYVRLVGKIVKYIESKRNTFESKQRKGEEIVYNSWIDSFIMGDIYILGQGFDPSEIDLWWLLNRKNAEKAKHGNVYFFEPFKKSQEEKIELLKCFRVEVDDLGVKEDGNHRLNDEDYATFYSKAIQKMRERVAE